MAKERLTSSKQAIEKTWVLYVLLCQDDTLYCGITNDLERRIAQHDSGKGARYTKGRGPVKVLKSWPAASMSAALKAERAFKKLTKEAKLKKLKSRSRKDAVSLLLKDNGSTDTDADRAPMSIQPLHCREGMDDGL